MKDFREFFHLNQQTAVRTVSCKNNFIRKATLLNAKRAREKEKESERVEESIMDLDLNTFFGLSNFSDLNLISLPAPKGRLCEYLEMALSLTYRLSLDVSSKIGVDQYRSV